MLGAGPMSFELVEPFVHWRLRVDGMAVETSTQAQIDGWMPGMGGGDEVPVELEVDIRSAAPPWESGTPARRGRPRARDAGGGRPHGRAALRAAVPGDRTAAGG